MTSNPQSQTCSVCGAVNPVGAPHCANCGEAFLAAQQTSRAATNRSTTRSRARETETRRRAPPTASPRPPSVDAIPRTPRTSPERSTLHGTVNRFEGRPSGQFDIWTFHLEVAETDGRVSNVLVPAGPSLMHGSLHNGDHVHVTGKYEEGVFHARRLFSESIGASVGPKKSSSAQRVVGTGIIVIFALFAIVFALSFMSDYTRHAKGSPFGTSAPFYLIPILIAMVVTIGGAVAIFKLWRDR